MLVTLGIPADQWRPGGVASTILTVVCNTFESFSSLMVSALSSNFLDYTSGSWLVLLAYYVYGVTAQPATFATGQLTLTNTEGGIYDYAENGAVFLNQTTQIQYTNSQAFALGSLSTVTFDIVATTAGSVGSSPPGAISQLVTTMLGVTASNALSVVGQDAQSDASIKTTCYGALGATSNDGPRQAYQYAVTTAYNPVTNASVNINRVQVSPASSNGIVSVYCASPSGAPIASDLVAAAANVEALCRPNGVSANVYSVGTVADSDTIVVWAQAAPGLNQVALTTAIETALSAYIAAYPIGGLATTGGGYLFGSLVDGIIYSVNPNVYAITGTTDHAIATGYVITDATSITVNVVAP
jgi:hypothetical protein